MYWIRYYWNIFADHFGDFVSALLRISIWIDYVNFGSAIRKTKDNIIRKIRIIKVSTEKIKLSINSSEKVDLELRQKITTIKKK